jgi:hypothetical protein
MTARASRWFAALTGVVAALVVLAVAEAVSLLVGPAGSPLFAVGSLVIDLVPPGVKELVISLFGTGDKAVLLTVLGVLVGVLAAAAGVVEARRSPWGVVMFGDGRAARRDRRAHACRRDRVRRRSVDRRRRRRNRGAADRHRAARALGCGRSTTIPATAHSNSRSR